MCRDKNLHNQDVQVQPSALAAPVTSSGVRGAAALTGMGLSGALLTPAQSAALRAGTESFVGRGSALVTSMRDRLASAGKGGSGGGR